MICDRCGFKYWNYELRMEWTGLMVCSADWDPRHPQDFVRGVPDHQAVAIARPEPADVFIGDTVDPWSGFKILLSGDMQVSGTDALLLSGDMQVTGTDALLFS